MAEGQRGRPRKHLEEHHHYKPSDSAVLSEIQMPEETPIPEAPLEGLPIQEVIESIPVEETISTPVESPAQEKIEELVQEAKNGWSPIESSSRNGMPVWLTDNPDKHGVLAFWKRTRAFNAKKWQEIGYWCDHTTGVKIPFEAQFWRPRFN